MNELKNRNFMFVDKTPIVEKTILNKRKVAYHIGGTVYSSMNNIDIGPTIQVTDRKCYIYTASYFIKNKAISFGIGYRIR